MEHMVEQEIINWEYNGMEVTVGELRAPTFSWMKRNFGNKYSSYLSRKFNRNKLMAQEYNLSEICHWMDQRTSYTMVLEEKCFMQLQIAKETGWNVHKYLIQFLVQ